MVAIIAQQALPQGFDGLGRTFDALHEELFGVEQVTSDVHALVFLAAQAQQVEQMQAAQFVGGFGTVNQAL